jgi:5-oxoprolinase (ATP-hydrolysing) subunit C
MLIVERVGPLVTIQDAGRFGHACHGVPRSGPLDHETFARTVDAVSTDVAIEIPLVGARFRFNGRIAIDGELQEVDGVFDVPRCDRAVRYLAVAGGLDVPEVLGSRATLITAAIGGFEGRMLRAGDRIAILPSRARQRASGARVEPRHAPSRERLGWIPLIPTFDAPADVVAALTSQTFTIDPRSDRTGTRLIGHVPPPPERMSRPVVAGAIQIPPSGSPIVLGPDGPTTGGYPVIAVLPRASRDQLARRRPGEPVQFELA